MKKVTITIDVKPAVFEHFNFIYGQLLNEMARNPELKKNLEVTEPMLIELRQLRNDMVQSFLNQ